LGLDLYVGLKICHVFLRWPTKLRQNRPSLGRLMMSYRFFQDGGWQPSWVWSG